MASRTTVRNLEVLFDQNLSFDAHIKQVSRTASFHLLNIVKIRNILSQGDAEKLVHAFVTSRSDQCNSLLLGCRTNSLKSLQLIQNAAARVLMRTNRRDHISLVLVYLHWLPVKFRIEFKILLLTYKALNDRAPSYLKDLIFLTEHFVPKLQVYLLFPEFLKAEWEAEPSVIRPLSCGISCQ